MRRPSGERILQRVRERVHWRGEGRCSTGQICARRHFCGDRAEDAPETWILRERAEQRTRVLHAVGCPHKLRHGKEQKTFTCEERIALRIFERANVRVVGFQRLTQFCPGCVRKFGCRRGDHDQHAVLRELRPCNVWRAAAHARLAGKSWRTSVATEKCRTV